MSVMTSPPKKYGTPKSALDLAILEGHEKVVLLMRGWDDSWALQQQRNIHPVRHLHHLQEQENIGSVLVSSRSNHTITTVELSPWEKGLPIWLWTHRHIDAFLLSLHLQQYTRSFQRFFIDGPALLELTESKLERLKISNPRHRQKILEAIQALRLQLAYN
jgi:hypothetical protein